jgi:hypothetical protein
VAMLQVDWVSGCEGITVFGREGARESQSGARKLQLKLPLSWQLLRVLLVEHFKTCQFLLASGHQSY